MASPFPILYSPSRSLRGSLDPFLDLSREMNRLMDNFFPGAGTFMGVAPRMLGETMPRIDVQEDQNQIRISAELPGVSAEDVDVRVDADTITICGEKKSQSETSFEQYRLMERTFGSFRRTVPLPFAPDPSQISAEYANGVLTICVPKQAQVELSQRIQVKDVSANGGRTQQGGRKAGEIIDNGANNVEAGNAGATEGTNQGSSQGSTIQAQGEAGQPQQGQVQSVAGEEDPGSQTGHQPDNLQTH